MIDRTGDRLSPDHLARWRKEYADGLRAYIEGATSRPEAEAALERLGYRQDALRAESLVWARLRDDERRKRGMV